MRFSPRFQTVQMSLCGIGYISYKSLPMTRTLISTRLIRVCSCPHFSTKLRFTRRLFLFLHIKFIFRQMEYQCGGHLREYDSSTDCLYMFFDLGYEPWLELGPGLSQPEAFEKAQAWIWSSLSHPKPGHSRGFRAKPGLHITTWMFERQWLCSRGVRVHASPTTILGSCKAVNESPS